VHQNADGAPPDRLAVLGEAENMNKGAYGRERGKETSGGQRRGGVRKGKRREGCTSHSCLDPQTKSLIKVRFVCIFKFSFRILPAIIRNQISICV